MLWKILEVGLKQSNFQACSLVFLGTDNKYYIHIGRFTFGTSQVIALPSNGKTK